MSVRSLEDLRRRVVEILQEDPNQSSISSYSPARVVANLNSAYGLMSNQGRKLQRFELLAFRNATADNEGVLDVLWDSARGRLGGITVRSNDSEEPNTAEYLAFMHAIRQGGNQPLMPRYEIIDGRIRFLDRGNNGRFRIWFYRATAPLTQGTAQAGTVNSITFAASPTLGETLLVPSAYQKDFVQIVSGTGAGQRARITSFDPTTLVATCESVEGADDAFSVAPDATSVYSTVPWFPEEFDERLCYLAASKFTKAEQVIAGNMGQLGAETAEWNSWVAQNEDNTPKQVVNTGFVQSGKMGGGYRRGRAVGGRIV